MVQLVTDYLDNTAKKYPDKIAFEDEKCMATFQEVLNEASSIATSIANSFIFKRPIAVYMDKSIECINSFLGVLYSGNFYTVLDTHMPLTRIEKILETLEPAAIITDTIHKEEAMKFAKEAKVFLYEELKQCKIDTKILSETKRKMVDTDVMYVLFTSGSTGVPKGVVIPHRAVIEYIEWGAKKFDLDINTIFGNQTPFYFIMSGFDIYQTLRNGCKMCIIPTLCFSFPANLMSYLQEHNINTIFWVPSILCFIANLGALSEFHLNSLKCVMFGGEVMPTKQLNMWRKEYPTVQFVNQYGPTELTDICAYYIIDRPLEDSEPLPIGRPCEHMDLIILDENDKEAIYGEIGELCGRGPSVTYGYYNAPEKTKEVFIQNPLNKNYPEIIYRTGDLVKYNTYDELVYVSRKDSQIKYLGNRIELGEIETGVSSIDGIKQNCCLYDKVKLEIVLFYVGEISKEYIREELKDIVPTYMLPKKIIQLEAMPQNLNGKIDRKLLNDMIKGEK